jgi:outer membrane protein assembly factor BamB
VADGRIYTSVGSSVLAFDLASGERVAEHTLPVEEPVSDPVVADGVVFVARPEVHALAAE